MSSLKQVLESNDGFGPGFDFARIALAMGILAFHSAVVVGSLESVVSSQLWLVTYGLVPMFFALSGFLIAGSGLRLGLKQFLLNRGMRIVPALAVEVFISAFLIGAVFTTLSLSDYFLDYDFYEYFLNIVGVIQYDLPGVFLENKSAGIVNLSLWTIPYEILCYIVMSFIIVFGLLHRRQLLIISSIAFISLPIFVDLIGMKDDIGRLGRSLLFGRGSSSFQCFMAGIIFYLYREKIPVKREVFLISVALLVIISFVGNKDWRTDGILNFLVCPLFTYVIIFIGVSNIPPIPIYSQGDYSYGVYLYGYPVQQSLIASLPQHTWWINFLASLVLVTLVAAFSWHWIEKPILKQRKRFSFVGRKIAEEDEALADKRNKEPKPGGGA